MNHQLVRVCFVLVPTADLARGVQIMVGFHARAVEEFALALHKTLHLRDSRPEEELAMRQRSRANSLRFGQVRFEDGFRGLWDVGCVSPP